MTAATVTIGGPLARACLWCKAAAGERCTRKVYGSSARTPCPPHAGRSKDAPPVQQAGAGDLVLVRTNGTGRAVRHRHVLALLVDVGESVRVRLWNGPRATFARPRMLPRAQVVQLADEAADARAGAARAFMDRMHPARDVEVLSKAHGRLRIEDAGPASVRWVGVDSGERGMTSRQEWSRAAVAGDLMPAGAPAQIEQLGRGGSCSPRDGAPLTTGAQKG